MNRSVSNLLIGLVVLGLAPACAGIARAQVAGADSSTIDWSRVPEYRIVPGDMLALNFGPRSEAFGDLKRDALVRPDGRISVYPVGDVIAAGRTPRELEEVLVELLGAELKQPRVTVEVSTLAGNQVHVMGRVRNPGSYEVVPFMSVTQAIARAGGFQDDASRNSVLVFHREGGRSVRVARIRLDRALKQGLIDADMPLSRFDIVYVPRSTVGNIDIFTRQLFGGPTTALNFAFTGWELFNLDRVFVVGPTTSSQ